MHRYWITSLLVATTMIPGPAQQPFVCQGDYYLALTPGGSSTVYRLEIDPSSGEVTFNPLPAGSTGYSLNAIGYRSTDNFIYGMSNNGVELFRIDADGRAERLATLEGIDRNQNYPAGDVSPDGRYLVILGNTGGVFGGVGGSSGALVFIDLASPTYATRVVNLQPNNSVCFDIAFDPEDGQLYGFDARNSRLVVIDPEARIIHAPFPSDTKATTMGSLFFDAFGTLYGYGRQSSGANQNTLFRLDKRNGAVHIETTGPEAQRSDGCSCPFTIELKKRVYPPRAVACTPLTYTFEFANASGRDQPGITFEDIFPEDFVITGVHNVMGGKVISGVGGHVLRIEDMTIPLGRSTLEVTLTTNANAYGQYFNQARLLNLPANLGGEALSDNPLTLARIDPTPVFIDSLKVDFSDTPATLCQGDALMLAPGLPGVRYQWSDGSAGETLVVRQGGEYAVTVSSGCAQVVESIYITEYEVRVALPETMEVLLGDSVRLRPRTTGAGPLRYAWESDGEPGYCRHCETIVARPYFDTYYKVGVSDAHGCVAWDSVLVKVNKKRYLYIPNAFSPNGDGVNERFYAHSRFDERMLRFRIFSRWGELLYECRDGTTNDPTSGWDGTYRGRPMNAGVYVYQIEIEFLDGVRTIYAGDLTLVR